MGYETMPTNDQEGNNEEKGGGAKNALENLKKKLKENKDQLPKEDITDEYGDLKPEYVKGLNAELDKANPFELPNESDSETMPDGTIKYKDGRTEKIGEDGTIHYTYPEDEGNKSEPKEQ